jgi:hypothetical protein
MSRETFKLVMAIGVLLNSALYLGGCMIAGLVIRNGAAWKLALAALGITYLSYVCHFSSTSLGDALHSWGIRLVFLSVALGVVSGLALLFW